jgi:hypothetical protein
MRRMPLTVLMVALGGCAGMDSDECRTADWRAIGYEDGVQGQSAAHFCRPQNGYHLGAQGHPDPGICPVVLEAAFVAAHADGYGLYERGAVLDRLRKKLHYSRKRSKEIEYLLAERTALLIAPHLAATERATIAVDLKQLTEERIELERAIDQLEDEYVAAELEYEDYRSKIADPHGD